LDTLPDHLREGLSLVFVGLNPRLESVRVGHYFASPRNRIWTAANQAGIFDPPLDATSDARALEQGIGFTDVVKRPTAGSSDLRAADYTRWAPELKRHLLRCSPRIVRFHGKIAYVNYLKRAEGVDENPDLGLQDRLIGQSRVFLIPNPSPANAAYSMAELIGWYTELAKFRDEMEPAH